MKRLKVHTEIWISKTLKVSRELSNSQILLQKMQIFPLIWRLSTSHIILRVTSIAILLSDGCLFHRCNKHCSLIMRMSISQMWHACHSLIWGTFPWRRSAFPWVVTSGDESVRTCRVGVPREWPHSHPPAGCFLRWPWLILAPHRRFHLPDNKRNQLLHVIQSIHPSYLETSYFLEKSFKTFLSLKYWG